MALRLLLALVFMTSFYGCGEYENSELELVESKREDGSVGQYELSVETPIALSDLGLEISLVDILEDSRCPSDVYCLWSGRLHVGLKLKYADGREEMASIGVGPGIAAKFQNAVVTLELVDIHPAAFKAGQEMSVADYKLRLDVAAVEEEINLHKYLKGVRLSTLYDGQFGTVEFEFLDDQAYMILDPNGCQLDAMGRKQSCTEIAVMRRPVSLNLKTSDRNTVYLYSLSDSPNFGFVADFSFKEPRFRLVFYGQGGQTIAVRNLEAVQKLKMITNDAG